jgi:hypothetical protein
MEPLRMRRWRTSGLCMSVISATWEMEIRELWLKTNLDKLIKTLSQKKKKKQAKLGTHMVVHIYNPSYLGGGDRRSKQGEGEGEAVVKAAFFTSSAGAHQPDVLSQSCQTGSATKHKGSLLYAEKCPRHGFVPKTYNPCVLNPPSHVYLLLPLISPLGSSAQP